MVQAPSDILSALTEAPRGDRRAIKMITCVIRPEKLDAVTESLNRLNLVGGMTVTDVRGFGRQKGMNGHFMGGSYVIRFVPKVRVDLVVQEEDVPQVMQTIHRTAHTGNIGDGKVFVVDVVNALRIRTREGGTSAL